VIVTESPELYVVLLGSVMTKPPGVFKTVTTRVYGVDEPVPDDVSPLIIPEPPELFEVPLVIPFIESTDVDMSVGVFPSAPIGYTVSDGSLDESYDRVAVTKLAIPDELVSPMIKPVLLFIVPPPA